MSKHLIIEEDKANNLVFLVLSRSDVANAYSDEMISLFLEALARYECDDSFHCIIITGEGKFFSAGGDIKLMKEKKGMFSGSSEQLRLLYERGIQQIPLQIESMETPIIAMVNGAAIGAGLDLALMCDLRVSAVSAKFGETFTSVGLVPGDGGGFFLSRVVGYAKAMEMILTAKVLTSKEALDCGLVHKVVSDDQLKGDVIKLAKQVGSKSKAAQGLAKKSLKQAQRVSLQDHLNLVSAYQAIVQRGVEHEEAINQMLSKK